LIVTIETARDGAAVRRTYISAGTWRAAIIYIAAAALFLRFFDLPRKPLHHDEGVNALILNRLIEPPYAYTYDPSNYHGPTLYYLTWLSVELFGKTTDALRLGTAAAGFLAVLLLILLHPYIGRIGALAAAVLLALSPGAVYFSRYFIHEMPLVAATLALVVCTVKAREPRRRALIFAAAAAAGLMFATKETAIISAIVMTAAVFGSGVLVATNHAGSIGAQVAAGVAAARDSIRAGFKRSAPAAAVVTAVQLTLVFLLVTLVFYTSVFKNWSGAIDAVKTFAFWTKTGTAAHTQPWHAYLRWLALEESPLLLLGGLGAGLALWRRDNRFAVFSALWMLGTLTAYSVIPYKTPWLTLNVVAPLAICGGYAVGLFRRPEPLPSAAVWVAAVAAAAFSTYQSVTLSFFQYDNNSYPYVYAHTSREMLSLVDDIERIEELNPDSSIAVTSPEHFPLSWYLRRYRAGFWGRPVATGDPLVVASLDQQSEVEAGLGADYDRVRTYRLRPGVRLVLYVRRDLRRPPTVGVDEARGDLRDRWSRAPGA
jgi:uncharacterized protein (TIGR03663 family)